eukprot:7944441-Alexandrium_andersonii.AAC.1
MAFLAERPRRDAQRARNALAAFWPEDLPPEAAPAPPAEPVEPAPEPGAGSAAPSEPPSAPAALEGTEPSGGQSALAKVAALEETERA